MKFLKATYLLPLMICLSSSALAVNTQSATHEPTSMVKKENMQKDGEIIAMLIALNDNEIAASNEALKRKVSPSVEAYAKMLHKDHTKNLEETLNISNKTKELPVKTQEVILLTEQGKHGLNSLQALDDKKFQIDFIDAMVKGHTEALNKIDQSLKVVKNSALKKHLEATRTAVKMHLDKAKVIQDQLKSKK